MVGGRARRRQGEPAFDLAGRLAAEDGEPARLAHELRRGQGDLLAEVERRPGHVQPVIRVRPPQQLCRRRPLVGPRHRRPVEDDFPLFQQPFQEFNKGGHALQ